MSQYGSCGFWKQYLQDTWRKQIGHPCMRLMDDLRMPQATVSTCVYLPLTWERNPGRLRIVFIKEKQVLICNCHSQCSDSPLWLSLITETKTPINKRTHCIYFTTKVLHYYNSKPKEELGQKPLLWIYANQSICVKVRDREIMKMGLQRQWYYEEHRNYVRTVINICWVISKCYERCNQLKDRKKEYVFWDNKPSLR